MTSRWRIKAKENSDERILHIKDDRTENLYIPVTEKDRDGIITR